jgi:hypothetical protein
MTEHGSSANHPSGPENRLGRETSPYLLQHKHNPVAWWAWSPDALAEAQRTGKPILLSVGYAACHWCHVMAHESFEDEATAAVMNELFVNIKVDRRSGLTSTVTCRRCILGGRAAGRSPCSRRPRANRSGAARIFPKTRATAGRCSSMYCARFRVCFRGR